MTRIITTKTTVLAIALIASLSTFAQTNVWTGSHDNDWNDPANWSANTIPTTQTDVQVSASAIGNYPVIDGEDGSAECRNFTVDNNAQVTLTGYGTLRIAGQINANNTINAQGGTVVLVGTAPQTIPAGAFFNATVSGLTVYNTTTVTLQGNLALKGVLAVQAGVFETSGGLTLKSTAQNTAQVAESTGVITGNVTVERYIPARRAFRFLTASTTGGTINSNWQEGAPATDPVGFGTDITGTGGTANGFDASTSNNPSLFTYNNVTAAWQAATSTNVSLTAGTPYRILVRGDRTINLASNAAIPTNTTVRSTGTLTQGDVVVANLNPAAGGFSFVGNPYQAAVDVHDVLNDNGTSNINHNFYYVWDPTLNQRGAYVTVLLDSNTNTNASSVANKYAHPGQAFFVETQTTGPAAITFREEHKNTSGTLTPNVYRTLNDTQDAAISLQLYTNESLAAGGTSTDGLLVSFAEGNSNSVDSFDAVKPINQDENLGLVNEGKTLSFESRAMPVAGEALTLTTTAYRTSNYTFKASVNNLEGVSAWLEDTHTGTLTALNNNTETLYSFSVAEGETGSASANRFKIVFQTTLSNDGVTASQFVVYPNPATGSQFNVALPNAEGATIKIYNQLGQAVAAQVAAGQNELTVTPQTQLANGLYMIEITSGTSVYTSKIIVKN